MQNTASGCHERSIAQDLRGGISLSSSPSLFSSALSIVAASVSDTSSAKLTLQLARLKLRPESQGLRAGKAPLAIMRHFFLHQDARAQVVHSRPWKPIYIVVSSLAGLHWTPRASELA
eukprot:6212873-Pleurochrysis_carterae.AAC.2